MRVKSSQYFESPTPLCRSLATALFVFGAALTAAPGAGRSDEPIQTFGAEPQAVAPDAKIRSDEVLKDKTRDDAVVPEGLADEPVGTPEANPLIAPDPSLQAEETGEGGDSFLTDLDALEAFGVDELSDPNVYNGINSGSNPPDTVGDIGPNHYVQMTNPGTFQVFDRDGVPTPTGPVSFGSLWPETAAFPGADPCTVDRGDPIVVYDHLADRWLLMQFSWQQTIGNDPQPPFYLCFALSRGPAPTPETAAGTWFLWTVNVGSTFPDYPKVGVWNDAYYMTTFEGGNLGVWALDRSNMLNGNALQLIKFTTSSLSPSAGVRETRILPADLNGALPPAGTPGLFLRTVDNTQDTGDADDRIELFEFVANFANVPASSFTKVQELDGADGLLDFNLLTCDRYATGASNAFRDCIPVPGAGSVDALSNRPMMQAAYRNYGSHEAMTVNQTVEVSGALNALNPGLGFMVNGETAGVRWYELRRSGGGWTIHQQGTYAAQNNPADEGEVLHRWMGSGAMDRFGNLAIGYSLSSDDVAHPGIRYAGRIPSDPLGLLPQSEYSISEGTVSPAGTGTRWGDYAAMSVDPVDDCTFWFTSHLTPGEPGGRTRIANFHFKDCNADLEVAKSAAPSPATAGQQIKYTIDVTNNGPLDATDVVVTDTLPTGFSYVADSVPAPECGVAGQVVTCNIADIDAGDSASLWITALIDSGVLVPGGPKTFDNLVVVDAAESDDDETNNSFTLSTLVNESADLGVRKTCKPDEEAPAGSTAFCEIDVENFGPSDARLVVLDDQIASDASYTVTGIVPEQGSCSAPGANVDVLCNLGTIVAGDVVKVTVSFTSNEGVDVNDTATVSSATPDPKSSNNSASGSVTFSGRADLSLTKIASVNPATPGQALTYTLTATNNGPSTASNVVIRDVVPAGLQITGVSASDGGTCVIGVPGNAALPSACSYGPVPNGGSRTMTINTVVLPSTTGVLNNNGAVASSTSDPNNVNNNASVAVSTTPVADIVVSKTSSPSGTINAGDLLSYNIVVTNNGPSDATDVSLLDNLPAEVNYLSFFVNGGGSCDASQVGKLSCTWAAIPAGASRNVNIEVRIKSDYLGGTISNYVEVNSAADAATPDDSTTHNRTVGTQADLWIVKTGNFPANNPSGTIIYRLTVNNKPGCGGEAPEVCGAGGPSDAQNVVVTDYLPSTSKKLVFQFATAGCTYNSGNHRVTCNMGAIPYGQSRFVDIQLTAKGGLGEILNTATVTSTTPDLIVANNTHSLLMIVQGGTGDTGGPGGGRGKGPKG